MNLGGRFELTGDYEYDQDTGVPPLVTEWKELLEWKSKSTKFPPKPIYKKLEEMFLQYEDTAKQLNLPALFVRQVLSDRWIPQHAVAEKGKNFQRSANPYQFQTANRITIEYDSMSEGDIEEIEKAMSMYSDELEKYESIEEEKYDSSSGVSETSEQKASLYDSSSEASVTSEQKASLYDSSSDAEMSQTSEQKASLYDSSSDAESSRKASLYDSSSDAGSSVKRVLYDSSSEIASETEMDYSLHSDSESDVNMEEKLPYDSNLDLDTI